MIVSIFTTILFMHSIHLIDSYTVIVGSFTWQEAETQCQNQYNTHLASIHDSTENIDALDICHTGINDCWIGLNDVDNEAFYQWSDNTLFGFGTTVSGSAYPWGIGQPDNYNNADCVSISDIPRAWYDADCAENKNALCNDAITGTSAPTTSIPTTVIPTTSIPTTSLPTTSTPTTSTPTTSIPTTSIPTTSIPTTSIPTTSIPTTNIPTTNTPTTDIPTLFPTTSVSTSSPTDKPSHSPTFIPTKSHIMEHGVTMKSTVQNEGKQQQSVGSSNDSVLYGLLGAILGMLVLIAICFGLYWLKRNKNANTGHMTKQIEMQNEVQIEGGTKQNNNVNGNEGKMEIVETMGNESNDIDNMNLLQDQEDQEIINEINETKGNDIELNNDEEVVDMINQTDIGDDDDDEIETIM